MTYTTLYQTTVVHEADKLTRLSWRHHLVPKTKKTNAIVGDYQHMQEINMEDIEGSQHGSTSQPYSHPYRLSIDYP